MGRDRGLSVDLPDVGEEELVSEIKPVRNRRLPTSGKGTGGNGDGDSSAISSKASTPSDGSGALKSATGRKKKKKKSHFQEQTFQDLYEVDEGRLGTGSFSSVVPCHEKKTGKEFAVKIIKHDPSGEQRDAAYRELEVLQRCKGQENIVQVKDFFETGDTLYLVFEKMVGGSLLEHVEARHSFTELEASQVIRDISTGLAWLHANGIAHRDLKPANVLCARRDRASPAKLCDFNLAGGSFDGMGKVSTPHMKTPAGSLEFLAPEVIAVMDDPHQLYNKQCDIWSLGTILYILLAGYPPFYEPCEEEGCMWAEGESCDSCAANLLRNVTQGYLLFPDEQWQSISPGARRLVKRMLALEPRDRPTADELLRDPWINNAAPDTPLMTPQMLSMSLVRSFTSKANSFSRLNDDDIVEELQQLNAAAIGDGGSSGDDDDDGGGDAPTLLSVRASRGSRGSGGSGGSGDSGGASLLFPSAAKG